MTNLAQSSQASTTSNQQAMSPDRIPVSRMMGPMGDSLLPITDNGSHTVQVSIVNNQTEFSLLGGNQQYPDGVSWSTSYSVGTQLQLTFVFASASINQLASPSSGLSLSAKSSYSPTQNQQTATFNVPSTGSPPYTFQVQPSGSTQVFDPQIVVTPVTSDGDGDGDGSRVRGA